MTKPQQKSQSKTKYREKQVEDEYKVKRNEKINGTKDKKCRVQPGTETGTGGDTTTERKHNKRRKTKQTTCCCVEHY